MIKENKDFFLYVLGIIILIFGSLFLFDYIVPDSIADKKCGFLGFKCWLDRVVYKDKVYMDVPEMTIDTSKDYKAVIKTSLGDFEIDLYEENAPIAVNSFIFLVNDGYYNDVKFHRVVQGFLVQTGDRNTLDDDLNNDGEGGPGYVFEDEINWKSLDFSKAKMQQLENLGFSSNNNVVSKHLKHKSVAMANSGPDTNGSQFFIITASSDDQAVRGLEGRHTVFGEVTSGWEVIEKIEDTEVDDPTSNSPRPVEDILIIDVEIKVS